MIDAFGNYHRLFWNCQTFANCFLCFICEEHATFNDFTAGKASNLVSSLSIHLRALLIVFFPSSFFYLHCAFIAS